MRHSHVPAHRHLTRASLAALFLALPAILFADQPDPAAEPSSSCPVLEQADELLAEADSASDAAIRWLQSSLAAHYVDDARSIAEHRWQAMLDEARAQLDFGTFLYTPNTDTDQPNPNPWTPIAELSEKPANHHIVLLVHGLDEPGDIWRDLAPALNDAGHTVARFNYANDQDPARSTEQLAEQMRAIRTTLGATEVDLVCHSMGGLVARDLLTRKDFYNADASAHDALPAVPHIITIGTPNKGSALAPLRSLAEIREQFARWIDSDTKDCAAILGFLTDGDGEAADALEPGSDYLEDLNARPLPTNTKYTIIIGRAAHFQADDLDPILDSRFAKSVLGEQRIARLRKQTDQAVGALGDGVVTVESAHLDGVTDTVVLDANHRSLVRHIPFLDGAGRLFGNEPTDPPAIPIILDRLAENDE